MTSTHHKLRILSLGWGVQSWTLAAMAALGEIEPVDYAVHADTTWEHSGTYEHAREWTPWLGEHGVKVVTVWGQRPDVVREDWKGEGLMIPAFTTDHKTGASGKTRRQCTDDWKIQPQRRFISDVLRDRGWKKTPGVVEGLMGISLDEYIRMRDSDVAYITNSYPLVDKRATRADCVGWLEAHGLDVPVKSSCVFCPFKNRRNWQELKRGGGSDWEAAVAVDAHIRNRRPTVDAFVHVARKPLAEAVKIPEDEGARQLELPCDSGHCFT